MAQVRHYSCSSCKLEGSVTVGGVRKNYRTHSPFPIICRSCRAIRDVNKASSEDLCCMTCGSVDIIEYGEHTRSRDELARLCEEIFALQKRRMGEANMNAYMSERKIQRIDYKPAWDMGRHECPRCQSHNLRFSSPIMFID